MIKHFLNSKGWFYKLISNFICKRLTLIPKIILRRSYENLPEFPISTTAQWFKTLRNKRWRLCDRNKNGTLCPTYGEHSVVPSSAKDDVLAKSVKFRDGMRFPVLSCLAGNQQNPLLRCSSVGFMEARNKYDEDILRLGYSINFIL